ncbi:3-hydroxyacyl-CoA dehydrogenase family protein [Chitinophaga defluvii]|uniref:3-hydroxyacyl-CoA dehydrogenase NAD-binding domain-containing protein n=1 Tax=Chitinophaga defluvii TaxID=3163343 RepID=A0ABV2SZ11_9BACT
MMFNKERVLIAGKGRMAYSMAVCLLQAGHPVILYTGDPVSAWEQILLHLADLRKWTGSNVVPDALQLAEAWPYGAALQLAIGITGENVEEKQQCIAGLEQCVHQDGIITINTESIPLSSLQEGTRYPARILGANWAEPVHTTYFLELIANGQCDSRYIDRFYELAKVNWKKDPYIIAGDTGIRARLISAMTREAFYLVENGYASVEDIDRACRNDAGYYLPFAGNYRYMDLMGTYAYGVVMKELNRELAKEQEVPVFFKEIIAAQGEGMVNGKGFYKYTPAQAARWEMLFRRFSYQIKAIIERYPFNYKQEKQQIDTKVKSL